MNFETESDNYVPPIRRYDHRIAVHNHARDETLLNHYRQRSDVESQAEVHELTEHLVEHFQREADQAKKEYRYLAVVAALREVVRFKDTPENRKVLQQAVELQTNLDMVSTTAQRQLLDNNVPGAISSFQSILEIKPNDAKAHGRLGIELAKRGEMQKAAEHLQAVAAHDPNDVVGVAMLGWLAYLQQRNQEALAYYEEAEKIEPREAKLHYQKGLVLVRLRRIFEAIENFKKALAIEPNRPDALQAIIAVSLESNQPNEALPFAERVVKLTESKDIHALLMLADVYAAALMKPEAIQANELAMLLAPSQDPSAAAKIAESIKMLRSSP